jgi:hypothetical protein
MVTQEADCFSVQWGGSACGGGDDWRGTNMVVMKEAMTGRLRVGKRWFVVWRLWCTFHRSVNWSKGGMLMRWL